MLQKYTVDIYSKAEYPANQLSNFTFHRFVFDGVVCNSMEGFLQSLKYKNVDKQKEICLMTGIDAKKAGSKKYLWKVRKRIFWLGKAYGPFSDDLQRLIDDAYRACLEQSEEFRNALQAVGKNRITHSIGKNDSRKTILTEYHFVRRLEYLKLLYSL